MIGEKKENREKRESQAYIVKVCFMHLCYDGIYDFFALGAKIILPSRINFANSQILYSPLPPQKKYIYH